VTSSLPTVLACQLHCFSLHAIVFLVSLGFFAQLSLPIRISHRPVQLFIRARRPVAFVADLRIGLHGDAHASTHLYRVEGHGLLIVSFFSSIIQAATIL